VRRCPGARTIADLRGHRISKICALFFLTLILIPFTAPFKTFELAGAHNEHSSDGLPKDKIGSDEKLTAPSDSSRIPPALESVIVKAFDRCSQVEDHPILVTILRL
jgi:hypothetical protein